MFQTVVLAAERVRAIPPQPLKPQLAKRGVDATVRSKARPERHLADSFITVRLAVARILATRLPRCLCCHRWRRFAWIRWRWLEGRIYAPDQTAALRCKITNEIFGRGDEMNPFLLVSRVGN